ncbi:AAA family ATPase [Actinomyces faecalis]|uniref:AAA family ATPase n=1 Tax=Actinomyces faecalis TaxID=2722820 RepID=UPI003CC80FD0
MEGTYPLPEAQRDRFMARMSMGYPDPGHETEMLLARGGSDPLTAVVPVASRRSVVQARQAVAGLLAALARQQQASSTGRGRLAARYPARYVVELTRATRRDPDLALGASPRAGLALLALARARAAMAGRGFVTPDDVAQMAPAALAHRLVPAGRHASATQARLACAQVLARLRRDLGRVRRDLAQAVSPRRRRLAVLVPASLLPGSVRSLRL